VLGEDGVPDPGGLDVIRRVVRSRVPRMISTSPRSIHPRWKTAVITTSDLRGGAPARISPSDRTRGCPSRKTGLVMAFGLMMSARGRWREIDGSKRLPEVIRGIAFADGVGQMKTAT